jgi:apolipoprotein N-acyltransferase
MRPASPGIAGLPKALWSRPGVVLASAPAVFLAGIAQSLSFSPFELWWVGLLSLAVLAHATANAAPLRAAALGWCFAVGWLVSGFWWLYISMNVYGGLSPALAAAAVLVLAALLGLYYAAAMAMYAAVRVRRPALDALLWGSCWMLAELARGIVFTGFPWIASGYAHAVGPLAAWAPWIGVYGLCFVAATIARAAASLPAPDSPGGAALRQRAALAVLMSLLVLVPHALPGDFTRSTGTMRVSLLQPNIAQDVKFDPARLESQLTGLVRQIGEARGDLVVTPESVVPLARSQLSEGYWESLRSALATPASAERVNEATQPAPAARSGGAVDAASYSAAPGARAALIGIFVGDDASGYVNSVVTLAAPPAAADEGYRYGKRHLLPFGEIIPPGFHWFVELMRIPIADQERGQNTAALAFGGQRLRPLVCYEDLFGEEMVDSVVGPDAATVFVNVSNLAWFGRLLVQDQHLQFSQMRAIEFQRPLVRSTNTGATAVVDHHGRVTARLPPLVEGVLEATVEGRSGATPYARWLAALGLWPLIGLASGALALAWLRRTRDGRAQGRR